MARPKVKAIKTNHKTPKRGHRKKKVNIMNICTVMALDNINDLARKYRGKLNLNLTAADIRTNRTLKDTELDRKLIKWETEMNSELDPVIAVENFVDDEGPPEDFHYIRESLLENQDVEVLLDPSFLVGCDCLPRCSHKCTCPQNSHGKFAYDRKKCILLEPGSPVYECNQKCKCSRDCPNRVIQNGLTTGVCIFRTANGRGWGLKAREFIPKGKFVVEYVGEVITNEEAERRGKLYDKNQQTYLFDLDFDNQEHPMFTIDAYKYGNVSHFINHSCDPNLHVYSVWVDTLDPQLPRIGLFANRNIYVAEELTFDYKMTSGYSESTLISPNKYSNGSINVARAYCACGSTKCRKYLF